MRQTALVVLLSLLFVRPAVAACEGRPLFSSAYRLSALDLSIDGNDLWVATSYGLTLYDRSVTPPRPVTSIAMPGTTSRVHAGHSIAWVASGTSIYTVRKELPLRISGSVDLGATVNDMLEINSFLFVATSKGVRQVDLINPDHPLLGAQLSTSTGSALAVARIGSMLYAADGDSTVEMYDITAPSAPQKVGSFGSLARSSYVRTNGSLLFVSDGQQSQLFAPSGTAPVLVALHPSIASASLFSSNGVTWLAGNDRRLRALDFSQVTAPTTLWQTELPGSGGTLNRVHAISGAGSNIYVAAGDIGLVTIDTTAFVAPYALRLHGTGSANSSALAGSLIAVAGDTGLTRFSRNGDRLVKVDSWDPTRQHVIHDAAGTRVLTSSVAQLMLWELNTTPPSIASSVSMSSAVISAVLSGNIAYAVLANQTFWRVDFSASSGTVTQVSGVTPRAVAMSGSAVAVAETTADGRTAIKYWSDGNVTGSPQTITVEGAATSGIALIGARAVVATFKGITIADFAAGNSTVIPNTTPGTAILALDAESFVFLAGNRLERWNVATRQLMRSFNLPSEGRDVARGAAGEVLVSTPDGVVTVNFTVSSGQPSLLPFVNENHYEKNVVTDGERLILFDGRNVQRFDTRSDGTPTFLNTVNAGAGVVDVASLDGNLYTLTSGGKLSALSPSGALLTSLQLPGGNDLVAQRIVVIRGALHVSILQGCGAGACEKRTIVVDPRNGLVQTATYGGGIVDAAVAGNTAYVLLDLPNELRKFDVTNPWQPVMTVSVPVEGNGVSVAWSERQSSVYVLGQRLTVHSASTLGKTGQLLDAWVADPSGRVSYFDQKVRVSGDCALIVGRAYAPAFFAVQGPANWVPVVTPALPAAAKALAIAPDVWYVLTDYSLEVWSNRPAIRRARPVR